VPTAYRSPSPLRHAAFVVGGLVAVMIVLACAVTLLDQLAQRTRHSVQSFAGVEQVKVDLGRGNVDIVPARGKKMRVLASRKSGIVSASSSYDFDGRKLELHGGCRVIVLTCEVDYKIEVPRGTAVHVRGFAGSVTARNIRGSVDLSNTAGDVRAFNIRGPRVELSTKAGSAEATDIRARYVSVQSAAGNASARLLVPARDLRVETHAGDAKAIVPDVGYRIDAGTDGGDTHVRVRRSERSSRVLRVRTNAGSVSVLPLRSR
jgi:hypothetical protein